MNYELPTALAGMCKRLFYFSFLNTSPVVEHQHQLC